jgi:preprotein translocase subunit SecG
MLSYISTIILMILGLLLIFIILLQRGRGGGLAGAFGGLGGQSAFGTKAGDVFTKITVVIAVIWVAMAGLTGFAHLYEADGRYKVEPSETPGVSPSEPPVPTDKAPAEGAAASGGSQKAAGEQPSDGPSLSIGEPTPADSAGEPGSSPAADSKAAGGDTQPDAQPAGGGPATDKNSSSGP